MVTEATTALAATAKAAIQSQSIEASHIRSANSNLATVEDLYVLYNIRVSPQLCDVRINLAPQFVEKLSRL